jgi:hypothetical protein
MTEKVLQVEGHMGPVRRLEHQHTAGVAAVLEVGHSLDCNRLVDLGENLLEGDLVVVLEDTLVVDTEADEQLPEASESHDTV